MKIAAADTVGSALDPLLTGPTAIAFGQDEGATAKAVMDTMRPYKQVRITGALLGDRAIDADGVTRLAALPSRETCCPRSPARSPRRWRRPPACSTRRCATSSGWSPPSPTKRRRRLTPTDPTTND